MARKKKNLEVDSKNLPADDTRDQAGHLEAAADEKPATEATPDGADGERADAITSRPVENVTDDRLAERRVFRIKTIVQFKESDDDSWKEVVEVATVSKQGAGLTLSRECPVGRIISLVMQMPRDMRLYDHFAPVYPVLGIVQNCTPTVEDGKPAFHVGVAFFGKKLPAGFRSNPKQCYRINGLTSDGLWSIVESPNSFHARRHSRFWRRFEVTVSRRDQNKKAIDRKHVFTRDVSSGGMSLWGPLDAAVGDRLKITCKQPEFFAVAVVRNRTDHPTDETRSVVHLEFETGSFPVEKVHLQHPPPVIEDRPADLGELLQEAEVTVQ